MSASLNNISNLHIRTDEVHISMNFRKFTDWICLHY